MHIPHYTKRDIPNDLTPSLSMKFIIQKTPYILFVITS